MAMVEADLQQQTALAADMKRRMSAAEKALANFKRDLLTVVERAIEDGDICDDAWDRLDGIIERPAKAMTVTVEVEFEIDDAPSSLRRLLLEDADLERSGLTVTGLDVEIEDDEFSLGYQLSLNQAVIKNVKPVEE